MAVMPTKTRQETAKGVWPLVRAQHGVITRGQLRGLGYSPGAIRHRLEKGRLTPLWPGVYAVGRPDVPRRGMWKAATLACGAGYGLDGESGAALWGVRSNEGRGIEIAGPRAAGRALEGIRVRRVDGGEEHIKLRHGIPVLSLPMLFASLSLRLGDGDLEAALNEADKKDLIHVGELRAQLSALRGRKGVAGLRRVIDRATFRYTDSALERAMRPIFRRAGLGEPRTQQWVNGHRVDFHWPDLNFVIETDGGRFHRTAFQQTQDRYRDQAHTLAGTAFLRFTHGQIRFDGRYVEWAVGKKAADLLTSSGDPVRL